jgi:dimeric dUTPase (all-alpha-NTP-PPase superfamily)
MEMVNMTKYDKEIDITRNIKTIELLKSELMTDMASLFKTLVNGMREEVHESIAQVLSGIIFSSYVLGKRLGISYDSIEKEVASKVKLGLIENIDVEKYYGDLSELAKHLESSRKKRNET